MTKNEEMAFEKKADKMLAGHRQAPNGRNVFAFSMRFLNNKDYRAKFDDTFNEAPGSPEWFDRKFGKSKEVKANV